jgi:hypothetical protein
MDKIAVISVKTLPCSGEVPNQRPKLKKRPHLQQLRITKHLTDIWAPSYYEQNSEKRKTKNKKNKKKRKKPQLKRS